MVATWEVTRKPAGDLDEVFVAYAGRIVLEAGRPGRWTLTIDLAEGGQLLVLFRSVHGILGTFDIDEIAPRCPWLGPMTTPLMPSTTARYQVDKGSRGRLVKLEARGPNFLHVERLQDEVFWMSLSMPSGELLVSRLISAAKIFGEPSHEADVSRPRLHATRARRLSTRPRV